MIAGGVTNKNLLCRITIEPPSTPSAVPEATLNVEASTTSTTRFGRNIDDEEAIKADDRFRWVQRCSVCDGDVLLNCYGTAWTLYAKWSVHVQVLVNAKGSPVFVVPTCH